MGKKTKKQEKLESKKVELATVIDMCVLYHSNSHSLAEMDWINMGPTLYVSRFSCFLLKMTSMQRFINIEQKLKKLAHQTSFGEWIGWLGWSKLTNNIVPK